MRVEIQQLPASQLAGFRLAGAWETTVPQGFSRISEWVARSRLQGGWLAVYYGNPQQQQPAEEPLVDTGVRVPLDFILPPGSEDVSMWTIPAACYAVAQVQVSNGEFHRPWQDFFENWLPDSGYQRAEGPCFERYLNDGTQSGVWDFLICVAVQKRTWP